MFYICRRDLQKSVNSVILTLTNNFYVKLIVKNIEFLWVGPWHVFQIMNQKLFHLWFGNPVNSTVSSNKNLSTLFRFLSWRLFSRYCFSNIRLLPDSFFKGVSKYSFIQPRHWFQSLMVNYKHIIIMFYCFPVFGVI